MFCEQRNVTLFTSSHCHLSYFEDGIHEMLDTVLRCIAWQYFQFAQLWQEGHTAVVLVETVSF